MKTAALLGRDSSKGRLVGTRDEAGLSQLTGEVHWQ
jgi:hypothetical protein